MNVIKLKKLIEALDLLAEGTRGELTLSQALLLLHVGTAGGLGADQGSLSKTTGMSAASISRTVRILGPLHYSKRHGGYGLLTVEFDPADNRRRVVRLTPAGESLLREIAAAM